MVIVVGLLYDMYRGRTSTEQSAEMTGYQVTACSVHSFQSGYCVFFHFKQHSVFYLQAQIEGDDNCLNLTDGRSMSHLLFTMTSLQMVRWMECIDQLLICCL